MKRKEIEELKAKTAAELKRMIQDAKIDLEKFKLDLKLGKEKNTALKKEKKKDIARMLTFMQLNETEKGENNG